MSELAYALGFTLCAMAPILVAVPNPRLGWRGKLAAGLPLAGMAVGFAGGSIVLPGVAEVILPGILEDNQSVYHFIMCGLAVGTLCESIGVAVLATVAPVAWLVRRRGGMTIDAVMLGIALGTTMTVALVHFVGLE